MMLCWRRTWTLCAFIELYRYKNWPRKGKIRANVNYIKSTLVTFWSVLLKNHHNIIASLVMSSFSKNRNFFFYSRLFHFDLISLSFVFQLTLKNPLVVCIQNLWNIAITHLFLLHPLQVKILFDLLEWIFLHILF